MTREGKIMEKSSTVSQDSPSHSDGLPDNRRSYVPPVLTRWGGVDLLTQASDGPAEDDAEAGTTSGG